MSDTASDKQRTPGDGAREGPPVPFATGSEKMLAHAEGAIGWLVFNNPARHNAASLEMWEAVPRIVERFLAEEAVRVIVVRGAGRRAFVSGADISEFESVRNSREETIRYDAVGEAAMNSLFHAGKPTVAMINGYCIGGGAAIAVVCDLRIASDTSRFGVPAARLGVGYRSSGVKKLVELVGPSFAKEIFYTGRQFSAQEALAMGLVNRVVPEEQLENHVRELAGTLAGNAPLTLAAVKATVGELVREAGTRDLAASEALVEACFASEDYVEGRRAFMEKREPRFRGR
jgi:enoyl-CoA hydratase/carnithine racemase